MDKQSPLNKSKWVFKPHWFISLTTLILLVLFLRLSHWQYSKAVVKDRVQTQHQTLLSSFRPTHVQHGPNSTALSLTQIDQIRSATTKTLNLDALNDLPIHATGTWLTPVVFYHDNRINESQAGYHVMRVLMLDYPPPSQDYNSILVNLGWLPLPANRRQYAPELDFQPPNPTPSRVVGSLQAPLPNTGLFSLSANENIAYFPPASAQTALTHWRIQNIDIGHLNAKLNNTKVNARTDTVTIRLAPWVMRSQTPMRVNPTPVQNWTPINAIGMSADKHRGYALQWLAFTVLLLTLYIGLNLRKA